MDTREAQIEALSDVVYRWTPPAELQIAGNEGGARVRKIAEEMLAAVQAVGVGAAQAPNQELIDLREELQSVLQAKDSVHEDLTRSIHACGSLQDEKIQIQAELQTVDQTRLRLQAQVEREQQRAREEIAQRDLQVKELDERAKVAENDREFFRARAGALESSLERLLDRAVMISERRPIEDWNETLNEARHVLSNSTVIL